ncbi:MAG: chorismate synthase [Candidatus Abyssobacteria bacterium SURF_17]|uniref:Chorismate synthase n=1 Tax=Candidatus Abyssobacteria bacterium SURF_17 TaxID=2093361 RepID=A0A419F1S8_9BACT|nr:MAG: chorismate synthase [Candidatus Abyssubacteria bacterium SURF_17]
MFRHLTAGESHGRALIAILEGVPAGLPIDHQFIDSRLASRQSGYGRGARMKIEQDHAEFLSGIRDGATLGSPVAIMIPNKDWENWQKVMAPFETEAAAVRAKAVMRPRPGHADLAGALKYMHTDIRNVLERASARETAARTAVGAIAELLLHEFDITLAAHVIRIGPVAAETSRLNAKQILMRSEKSPIRCADASAAPKMMHAIDEAGTAGDTLGGTVEVLVTNPPVGLGSHAQWDRRLDGRFAAAVMAVPAIKAVEIGAGVALGHLRGSQAHDEIFHKGRNRRRSAGYYRTTNRAGGVEGGISNGEDIIVRATMKPIPTLGKPLRSVDIRTRKPATAAMERSDICAVPAASVIVRAVVAIEMANAMMEKFGGDSLREMRANFANYIRAITKSR